MAAHMSREATGLVFPQLHQLLTEQLQEDLLDDSVSTVTTEGGMADSTLLGDEMGVSLDHVTSPSQSHDLDSLLHNEEQSESPSGEYVTDSVRQGTNMGLSSEKQDVPSIDKPLLPSNQPEVWQWLCTR